MRVLGPVQRSPNETYLANADMPMTVTVPVTLPSWGATHRIGFPVFPRHVLQYPRAEQKSAEQKLKFS